MKKIINLLINLFIFLFILSSVNAGTEDFSAISRNRIVNLCSCSVYEDTIELENTGWDISAYHITGEDAARDWITFYPNFLVLSPGQKASVSSYIKPPCGTAGDYELKTTISTEKGLKKQIVQQASVRQCPNYALELKGYDKTGCPCSLLYYEFQIKNTGSFVEFYNLNVEEPYTSWATLTANRIILAPGETSSFFLYINSPCSKSSGDHTLNLAISSENSKLSSVYPLEISLLPCFDYGLELGDYTQEDEEFVFTEHPSSIYSLCEQELKIVPVLIENKADISNTYHLELHGKAWAYLEKDELMLNKTQKGIVNLVLSPKKIENKNYTFTLNAEALNGGIAKEGEVLVNLGICYLPSVTIEKKLKADYTKTAAPVTIKNTGSKTAAYSIETEGESWVTVEPSNITIEPGKEAIVELRTSPDENVKQGSYKTTLNILVNQSGQSYQEGTVIRLKRPGILSKVTDFFVKVLNIVKIYVWYFTGGLVLLTALVIVLSLVIRKRAEELPEGLPGEKAELKEKPKKEKAVIEKKPEKVMAEKEKPAFMKILPYILVVAVLGALIFLGIRYKIFASLLSLLRAYFLYIIIGLSSLIALIIILTAIRRRAELPEEPKEKKEKKEAKKLSNGLEKAEPEEEKPGFNKVIIYLLIVAVIAVIAFFAIRSLKAPAVDTALNASVNATSLDIAKQGLKDSVIEPSKKLFSQAYTLLKSYLLYIVIGLAALFILVLAINIIKKRKVIRKGRKAIKSNFVKTKRLVRKKKFKKQIKNVALVLLVLSILSLAGYYSAKTAPYIIERFRNISIKENFTEEGIIKDNITEEPFIPVGEDIKENLTEENLTKENLTEEPSPPVEEIKENITEEPFIPIEEEGIKTQTWNEDTTHKIDISRYFKDPDNDQLFYSSSHVDNITIAVNDKTGIAELKPEKDWHGKRVVVFTADDKKGGIVKSNNVTLIVKDVPESVLGDIMGVISPAESPASDGFISKQLSQLKDYLMMYISYIILGLSILLLIILFIRFKKQILDFLEENIEESEKKARRPGKRKKK